MGERIVLGPATRARAVAAAAEVLRSGGIALLPAEGVYGLHARADDPEAAARLRALKPREADKPYLALVATPADALALTRDVGPSATALMAAHWPGPLTLVLRAGSGAPPAVCGEDGTVALRCPGSDLLRDIIAAVGRPLVSTSANAPGDPPPSRVPEALVERVHVTVDAGPLSGAPSTVVSAVGDVIRLLRAGALRLEGGDA